MPNCFDFRVCLIMPPFRGRRAQGENLGIACVESALLQSGVADVLLVNRAGGRTLAEIIAAARSYQPHLIGIGLTSYRMAPALLDLARELKKAHECPIVGGGHHFMFRADELLNESPQLDAAVLGEGEDAIVEVAKAVRQGAPMSNISGLAIRERDGVRRTAPRAKQADLDTLPFPTREPGLAVYQLAASRGCYTTCSFCSVPQFQRASPGRALRLRSTRSVAQEAAALKMLGAKAICFVDDVFLLPGKRGLERAREIADVMQDLDLKWTFGCRTPELTEEIVRYCQPRGLCNVGLGLESGSPEVLERFSKRASLESAASAIDICVRHGVSILPYFIMFEPDMTLADIRLNIEFLNRYGLLWPSYARNALDPTPGTPAFERLRLGGRLRETDDGYEAVYADPQVRDLMALMREALDPARDVEHRLRTRQFQAEFVAANARGSMKQEADRELARLSQLTYEFFIAAISGNACTDRYHDAVANIGESAALV